jgi:hypothetical protein
VLCAENGLLEVEVGDDLDVRAPGRAGGAAAAPAAERAAAEEGLEHVVDAAEPERVAGAAGGGRRALGAEGVVALPLLGVAQDLVGGGDLLELGLGLGVAVARVGMQLAGEAAVGAFDLVLRGAARHAEEVVVVVCHGVSRQPSVRRSDRRWLTTATAAIAWG